MDFASQLRPYSLARPALAQVTPIICCSQTENMQWNDETPSFRV